MPIISVEGGIGAGKTTFLKTVVEAAGYRVLYEPVDKWSEEMIDGTSMFELYYRDKVKYGFAFQMLVLQTQVQELMEFVRAHPNDVIFCERCPLTNYKVFAQLMYEQGLIDEYAYRVYRKWYEFMTTMVPAIDGIVYLRVTPETCVRRIMKRNRCGEDMIELNYLKALHDKHEQWLMSDDSSSRASPPVVVVDGDGGVPPLSPTLTAFIARLCRKK